MPTRLPLFRSARLGAALAGLLALAACAAPDADLAGPKDPIGEFRLGYNIVVADNSTEVEPSRSASPEEWEAAFTKAINDRFSRYTGSQLYHIAILVDAFSIAPAGVPVLLNTDSLVAIGVTIWDDAAGGKINDEPEVFTVFERVSGEGVLIGSGATLTREEQIVNLAENGARRIEQWMRENPDWFAARPGAASNVRIVNNEVVGSIEPQPVFLEDGAAGQ